MLFDFTVLVRLSVESRELRVACTSVFSQLWCLPLMETDAHQDFIWVCLFVCVCGYVYVDTAILTSNGEKVHKRA